MDHTTETLIAGHIHEIMRILNIPVTDGNRETPKRIAKMWTQEVFANRELDYDTLRCKLKRFDSESYRGRMIVCKDIPFSSMCEHHWMPFMGTVTVGYVPDEYIIGLSKIPRIVKWYSKMPQLQEKYTQDIMKEMAAFLDPMALFVEVKATHTCVASRGIESPCETVTFSEYYKSSISGKGRKYYLNLFNQQKEV